MYFLFNYVVAYLAININTYLKKCQRLQSYKTLFKIFHLFKKTNLCQAIPETGRGSLSRFLGSVLDIRSAIRARMNVRVLWAPSRLLSCTGMHGCTALSTAPSSGRLKHPFIRPSSVTSVASLQTTSFSVT